MNKVKIVSSADWHLNKDKNLLNFTATAANFISYVEKEYQGYEFQDTLTVLAGDIFDKNLKYDVEDFHIMYSFLFAMSKISPLLIVNGNHDIDVKNTESPSLLQCVYRHMCKFNKIETENVKFFNSSVNIDYPFARFAIISHDSGNQKPVNGRVEGKPYISIFHDIINGAKTYSDFELESKKRITLDYFKEYDAVICGDVHKRQVLSTNPLIFYTGSPYQINISESCNNHGYAVFEVIEGKIKNFEFKSLPLQPISVRKYVYNSNVNNNNNYIIQNE